MLSAVGQMALREPLGYAQRASSRRLTDSVMPNIFTLADGLYAFSPKEVDSIYAAGRREAYAAATVIAEKGSPGDTMFILLDGEVEIDLGFQEAIILREVGDYFGELSFLHPGHLRSATIRARKDSTLCTLGQDVIEPLYRQHPAAVLNLFRRTCAFLIDSEERLLTSLMDKHEALTKSYDYLRRTREELNYHEVRAQTDELTGLYNRRCLMEQLSRGIEECGTTMNRVGLMMLDLDRFKLINDHYGHLAGDEVLRLVASVLRRFIRSADLPCRYGGDEFALLFQAVEKMPVELRAEDIRAAVEALPPVRPGAERISVSIGGTVYRDGDTAECLLARADSNLYKAKSTGRNRVLWRP